MTLIWGRWFKKQRKMFCHAAARVQVVWGHHPKSLQILAPQGLWLHAFEVLHGKGGPEKWHLVYNNQANLMEFSEALGSDPQTNGKAKHYPDSRISLSPSWPATQADLLKLEPYTTHGHPHASHGFQPVLRSKVSPHLGPSHSETAANSNNVDTCARRALRQKAGVNPSNTRELWSL